nr:sigma 54-interacting transcriptional regulator [Vagococcus sp. DIV0080]
MISVNKIDYLLFLEKYFEAITELTETSCFFATTQFVSDKTNKKTNIVNHHLNNLFKEDQLIKINSKPVYYLPKKSLETFLARKVEKSVYESFKELTEESRDVFDQLIGSQYSLNHVIKQGKIALSYPPKGMPFLLTGPTGSGKTFLVKQFYEYAKSNQMVPNDAPLITFNCAEYADNPELLSSKLFGYRKGSFTGAESDRKGLLELSDKGILFIDEVHRLTPENQEKLFYFIDEGKYKPIGENEEWHYSDVRLMFATTESVDDYLLETFIRRIPIVSQVPSLEERGTREKRDFLYYFFKKEAGLLNKQILIEDSLFRFLLAFNFSGNVGELQNLIKYICGNSYVRQGGIETLNVSVGDLPEKLKKEAFKSIDFNQKPPIEISPNGKIVDSSYQSMSVFFESIYADLNEVGCQYQENEISFYHWINDSFERIESQFKLIDNRFLIDKYQKVKLQTIIEEICRVMFETHQIEVHQETKEILLTFLELLISRETKTIYPDEVASSYNVLFSEKLEYVKNTVELFVFLFREMTTVGNVVLNEWDYLMLHMIFSYYGRLKNKEQINGVIICHGKSTATSIAETTNTMIGQKVYQGIDMDLEVSFSEIIVKLQRYLSLHETANGTIILIDIGHTQDLKKALETRVDGSIVIINNVSTQLALDVGFRIVNHENIEVIGKESSSQHFSSFSLFQPEKKKVPALIISCQSGIGTAKKLQEVISANLPRNTPIQLVLSDYSHLKRMKTNTTMFNRYEIIGILGTADPEVAGVKYIGIDDLVSEDGHQFVSEIFNDYLNYHEIQELNNGVMKTLSLENLVTMLSILNPEKTIELISEMIVFWEKTFKIEIPNNLKTALYIHISCMIERVITREYVKNQHLDQVEFEKNHGFFIETIKNGLEKFESVYHVEVDMGEIFYLHQLFQANLIGFTF